jgi:hypothetical protein
VDWEAQSGQYLTSKAGCYIWYQSRGRLVLRWGDCNGSERPEPGPYKCMLTLTSKTRFGAMRDCQEQTREGDLGGSPGHG